MMTGGMTLKSHIQHDPKWTTMDVGKLYSCLVGVYYSCVICGALRINFIYFEQGHQYQLVVQG